MGKTVLITGGTGSFGNAVLKSLVSSNEFNEIRIFSRDEKKQDDMRNRINDPNVKFFIGDVRDERSIDEAMPGVDYIFHAAALKQVPSCEFFPLEAVKTNVLGTDNVISSAIRHKIKKVVVLSTDKAVYPINAMGVSKAMMEKVMIARSRDLGGHSFTTVCGTRYGNVMGTRGSVVPLFVKQVKEGGPITITDPKMTRFMITLSESVNLVLFAFDHGRNGDIFVQKAPAATVADLAKAIKELYNSNSKTKVIGTRHGEKLYEVLVNREDMAKVEDLDPYYRIPADTRDLNYNRFFFDGDSDISKVNEYNSHNTRRLDISEIKDLLLKLPLIRHDILGEKTENYSDLTSLL